METIIKELEHALLAVTTKLHDDLAGVRSNRPSVQLVENIKVDYYGTPTPVKGLGSIGIRPPRDIEINVWDKGAIAAVMKGIQDANVGLSLSNEGMMIRASLPMLTEERREEFMKLAKKISEEIRIQVRARRDEANKKVKAAEEAGTLSEDQAFKGKEGIQKAVDAANKKVEALLEEKISELKE